MLAVDRLIHAARLRDAFTATQDLASRKPLEAQDRLSLQATVAALTGPDPLSRDMADIQLSILPMLPGWPSGLSIIRTTELETDDVSNSTLTCSVRRFGAQTSQLACGDPLQIWRTATGAWFHGRPAKSPPEWCPAKDLHRPALSACVAALVERFKDDGWRIVAQLAGDSRQRPGHINESLLLARLGLRIAEWLEQASEFDQSHPLKLTAAPSQQGDPPPAAELSAIASTPHLPSAVGAGAGAVSLTPPHADTWAAFEALLFAANPVGTPPCKRIRTEDGAASSLASSAQTASGVVPAKAAIYSDQCLRDLLSKPVTTSPRVVPSLPSGSQAPVIDLTGTTSPGRF